MKIFFYIICLLYSLTMCGAQYTTFTSTTIEGINMHFMITSEERKTLMVGAREGTRAVTTLNAISTSTQGAVTIPAEVTYHGNVYHVKSIGYNAFKNCANITNVIIPEGVEGIYDDAFSGCTSLSSINLPSELTYLGNSGFRYCSSLSSINIPEGLTTIRVGTFLNCPKLSNVHVENVDKWCEILCRSGRVLETNKYKLYRGNDEITSLTIPSTITSIAACAFWGNTNVEEIIIPESVLSIGDAAFGQCSALTSINIPNEITSIGFGAFSGCSSLTTIVLPENLTTIGEQAFNNCISLEEIVIPQTVQSIGNQAFYHCGNLQNIYSKIKEPFAVPQYTFSGISSSAILHVPYDKKSLYQGQTGWSQYVSNIVEDGVKVGDTFNADFNSDNTNYTGIYLVKSVEPFTAFLGAGSVAVVNENINDLEIPVTVTGGDGTTFSITGVGSTAFQNSSVSTLSIPANVRYIGNRAFANCSSLNSVTVLWRVPSDVETAEDCFDGISDEAVLYIPAGTKERYEATDAWNVFSQIIESSPISTGDISARYGSNADLPIYLRNTESISGLQFKLTLPEGVTVVDHESNLVTSTTERTEGFTIMGRKDPDEENSYLFVVLSLKGDAISGTEGAFMNVRLDIAQNVGLGVHDIKIEDVYMTTETFDTLNPAESTSELTVKDFMLGDVNNDGIINITDAIGIINYVLKNTPETFIEGAADVNQDGIINVTDAIGVINKILN